MKTAGDYPQNLGENFSITVGWVSPNLNIWLSAPQNLGTPLAKY
jgi:hypothetical protein